MKQSSFYSPGMRNKKIVHIGIDEVGRGPLAGPVTVAVLALPVGEKFKNLRDSKKLSELQRNGWFFVIKNNPKIFYATASVYPKVIDRINISRAANLAATRAFKKVMELCGYKLSKVRVFLDGGLYVNHVQNSSTHQLYNFRTIIRGDEKFNCIKLASIVAKVKRDRLLTRYHKKFPQYGFDKHKGYGTKAHIGAIKKIGVCAMHRLTFVKNFVKL